MSQRPDLADDQRSWIKDFFPGKQGDSNRTWHDMRCRWPGPSQRAALIVRSVTGRRDKLARLFAEG